MNASALPFYDLLTREERRTLNENLNEVSYVGGSMVHENGEALLGMLYVKEGRLSLSLLSEEGHEITLLRLRKGDACFLTATNVIPGIAFDVSIEAEQATALYTLSESMLSSMMKRNRAFAEYVHRSITENFSHTVTVLQRILFSSLDQRLASFLYEEIRETGSLNLSITHERIARHIGSAREVVSRTLKKLSKEGIVQLSRGQIRITDQSKLRKLLENPPITD